MVSWKKKIYVNKIEMGSSSSRPTYTPNDVSDKNIIISELRTEIRELKKQVETLKEMNTSLEEKRDTSLKKDNLLPIKSQKKKLSELSEQKIDEFVKKILKDKNINIKYFPDFVEEKLYRNVFTVLINLLDHLVDTTSIKILGHEIILDFTPEINNISLDKK